MQKDLPKLVSHFCHTTNTLSIHRCRPICYRRAPFSVPRVSPRVAVESIAPTILDLLDVEIPKHLKDPSLLKPVVAEPELVAVGA